MWQALISPIVNLVGGHLQRKAEEKKAVHEAKMVAIQQDGNWENIHANNAANSWKDEWFTILFSVPCVLAFSIYGTCSNGRVCCFGRYA